MQYPKQPMPKSISAAQRKEFSWQYLMLMLLCGCVLAAGFFFAARQHFMSMDYGFKNSKLRKQLEDLESEKRRLLLAREISLSPAEIRKASRVIGYRDDATGDIARPMVQNISAKKSAGVSVDNAVELKKVAGVTAVQIKTAATRSDESERRSNDLVAMAKLR